MQNDSKSNINYEDLLTDYIQRKFAILPKFENM